MRDEVAEHRSPRARRAVDVEYGYCLPSAIGGGLDRSSHLAIRGDVAAHRRKLTLGVRREPRPARRGECLRQSRSVLGSACLSSLTRVHTTRRSAPSRRWRCLRPVPLAGARAAARRGWTGRASTADGAGHQSPPPIQDTEGLISSFQRASRGVPADEHRDSQRGVSCRGVRLHYALRQHELPQKA